MKSISFLLLFFAMAACNNDTPAIDVTKTDTVYVHDTIQTPVADSTDDIATERDKTPVEKDKDEEPDNSTPKKVYANARFKDVTVEKIGDHKFLIKGKGQIFEAAFSWVVEDGHNELKKGFEMTDAGAPEWGNFSFVIDVPKKRPNSTLHLILFESSAKDGSRQHQLPVKLY